MDRYNVITSFKQPAKIPSPAANAYNITTTPKALKQQQ